MGCKIFTFLIIFGIKNRYVLGGPGIESRFSATVQSGAGAHPPSYAMGTGSLSRE
jgi:hypothetical protein